MALGVSESEGMLDRADALVWALTALSLCAKGRGYAGWTGRRGGAVCPRAGEARRGGALNPPPRSFSFSIAL